ncbi:MAG: hypothetical protein ACL7BU_15620 [Candidatus Phlomobacter fragariae]
MKVLKDNPDINWHKVENVYKNWDISQQQLHLVSAAVLAIATGAAASATIKEPDSSQSLNLLLPRWPSEVHWSV